MITVFKYPVPTLLGQFTCELPGEAEILQFAEQDGQLFFWAAINTEEPLETYAFCGVGTGQPWPAHPNSLVLYVNTVHTHGGKLVVHWFQLAGPCEE